MSLDADLLKQARLLATKDTARPKQASLRRSVSTAYYALFHLLIREATQRLLRGSALEKYRDGLSRAFQHGAMKNASKAVRSGGTLRNFGTIRVNMDLKAVAEAFETLQEERHRADYDLSSLFTKTEAMTLVEQAEYAFECWKKVRKQPEADVYLAALLSYGKSAAV